MLIVARFYGWTISEVRGMTADDFESASNLIQKIESREHILGINAAAYPTAKKSWQDKYHRKIYQLAFPPEPSKPGEELKMEDFASLMGGRNG